VVGGVYLGGASTGVGTCVRRAEVVPVGSVAEEDPGWLAAHGAVRLGSAVAAGHAAIKARPRRLAAGIVWRGFEDGRAVTGEERQRSCYLLDVEQPSQS